MKNMVEHLFYSQDILSGHKDTRSLDLFFVQNNFEATIELVGHKYHNKLKSVNE